MLLNGALKIYLFNVSIVTYIFIFAAKKNIFYDQATQQKYFIRSKLLRYKVKFLFQITTVIPTTIVIEKRGQNKTKFKKIYYRKNELFLAFSKAICFPPGTIVAHRNKNVVFFFSGQWKIEIETRMT